MSIIRNKKLYYINSRNRLNGDNSEFSYQIELPTPNYYDHVVVLQAVIPKSYYLVQEGYNTFKIMMFAYYQGDEYPAGEWIVNIPPGNYTRRSFQNVLTDTLNN